MCTLPLGDAQHHFTAAATVKSAAVLARHTVYDTLYDNCSTYSCHLDHVKALHAATRQLQTAMEQLHQQYQAHDLPVPPPILAQHAAMVQVAGQVAAHKAELQQHRTEQQTANVTEPHMEPLLHSIRAVGQLTHGAVPAETDTAIQAHHQHLHSYHHTAQKIRSLRHSSCPTHLPPFMC